NGVLVPINTELKTGDVVQIKTSKQSNGPSEDWLKIVKTSHARNKIRNFLLKKEMESRSENIAKGEAMFKEELKKRGLDEKEFMNPKKLETVFQYFTIQNYNDFMNAIAVKSLTMPAIFEKLQVRKPTLMENFDRFFKPQRSDRRNVSKFGVTVAGVDSIMISLAGCCSPVYGDDIVGYITKGQGVKVHRKDCPNVIHETRRLIHCEWDEEYTTGKYEVNLFIMSTDRSFLITDIVTTVSQCKAGLSAVNSTVNEDKITATTTLRVVVDNAEHLRTVIANLKKVSSVLTVDRITQ
ncbi:MAG: bifunctional (p)ppGpp synthetase/guanosine-3',5'-bis(diphosphate) 3'-pyrophosphohydrolase, partial [Erysipelotrichaceae bacterium]|nr:bifunctional (p)ppGpp synthetase/guanosine-3',5'-bis(diphosphate) 3'-pyrophosphohydrolase [Erysipelotrichaceae bacterium]